VRRYLQNRAKRGQDWKASGAWGFLKLWAPVGVSMATSSGLAVALKNSPDFNRPVTLQVGAEPPAASPHKSVMEMDQFFKRYYGEPAQSPHSSKFKPDPKAWYEHTLVVKLPDNDSKKKVRRTLQR